MESRFAHLLQRDTSVCMLRVKMSRRRSQSQKENRQRVVNTRRRLDKLPELEMSSLSASMANVSTIQEKTQNHAKPVKDLAVEERLKQLERWKERKALEKEKRERERKAVFRTGLYHPKDNVTNISLPVVPSAPKRVNENTRVTRSMKQQPQVQNPLKTQDVNAVAKKAQPVAERSTRSRAAPIKAAPSVTKTQVSAVEPAVRALSTRSTSRPPVPVVKEKLKAADVRTTRSRALVKSQPLSDKERNFKASACNAVQPRVPTELKLQEPEKKSDPPCSEEEDMVVNQAATDSVPSVAEAPNSFAPRDFLFQAPSGLSSFKFEPLSPRSADAFLTPSPTLPLVPVFSIETVEPTPLRSPHLSPPRTSPTMAPPTTGSPLEPKHDVPYFRAEIVSETDRLTALCVHWESKVEDESIPEEMRDCMRTAVGQARLLMKERFKQFSGLVDDCELGRGEKITTCTDLQGFWDMVYYQVEDVHKKFDSLKEAEGRGWVEEHKPIPRQRKVVKKPSVAPAKPTGTKAAAKSRLAAVKAAMKAKQQAAEAEKAAKDAGNAEEACSNSQEPQLQEKAQATNTVVFDGGFFKVESPAKPSGAMRRSSRLSAAVLPQASPCSNVFTPRRVTRRSLALAQTPLQTVLSPAHPVLTPAHLRLTLNQTPAQAPQSQCGTPQSSTKEKETVNVSVCFSPVREGLSDDTHPDGSAASAHEVGTVMPVDSFTTTSVDDKQVEPAEGVHCNIPFCPTLSLSPCKTPPVSQAPEPSSLSFTLSPSVSSRTAVENQESLLCTPEISVEEIPELDFERYLQPSQRASLSPRDTETPSPLAVDVEMESPRSQSEDLLTRQEPPLPVVPSVFTLQSPQVMMADSPLLLFTPELKDRIRQSVCPSDLMVFTPPSNV